MSFKFKPEDFETLIGLNPDEMRLHDMAYNRNLCIAAKANALLEAHLKTLPRVYGNDLEGYNNEAKEWTESFVEGYDTHTAILFDCREINKDLREAGDDSRR